MITEARQASVGGRALDRVTAAYLSHMRVRGHDGAKTLTGVMCLCTRVVMMERKRWQASCVCVFQ